MSSIYPYAVQTAFDKRHIIFGLLNTVDLWCTQEFGSSSYEKSVLTTDNWRITYRFKESKHAVLFALRWS